ncbi:bifunctional phosphopantothenoylcysteine decarboxylase/phosphopantothenate--cysteine ligase CoaBC [Microbacterium rhizomatis]|uniref:Coenzyme A biosynthesis bifunctional protein CoaBC n=1 Tax=Microbacterium rhizomatis TaxID=1631477 RepID=A0A5J5J6A9_9MICO|nr:bifunctional phosphopantothenoylcysteine decarboxylase/phosphopantothenate--cysteine ligase CoaBC [Microbacterium rhizomatis]KAA9111747.1 bifunctional phosphopantothenoylcysteine decarboxylase/phosphopantothenate--cysteine ligase CoaBC [Microbacterium rhizomatis]
MNIVVGVTGGIAAYKTIQVVRELVLAGHTVRVIATDAALRFVGAPTWEAISRNALNTSIFDDVAAVRHVALGQQADVVVIAPATANTIAKLAAGIADDLLGTTVLASRAPLVIAPAMHTEMWQHPATVANIQTLRERGVVIVGPETGRLTGPDVGPGRVSEPGTIVAAVLDAAGQANADRTPSVQDLTGRTVLITAGGTREPIDPVRYLANHSSGKQGVAFALAAAARGAEVTVIAAHLDAEPAAALAAAAGDSVRVVSVSTAAELAAAVDERAGAASVVIMAAAVADFTPEVTADRKIKKAGQGERLDLALVRTRDVLGELVAHPVTGRIVVGFAAETADDRDELIALAREKVARKPADLLVANPVGGGRGFGTDANDTIVISASGDVVAEVAGSKREVADAVLDLIAGLLTDGLS